MSRFFFLAMLAVLVVACDFSVPPQDRFVCTGSAQNKTDAGSVSSNDIGATADINSEDAGSKVDAVNEDLAPDVAQEDTSKDTSDATKLPECTTTSDCNDGNWCTDDVCEAGVCKHINFDDNINVRSCEADGNPCTVDYCVIGGICKSMQVADIKGCMTCNTDADCGKATIQYCSKDGKYAASSTPIKCNADYLCVYNPTEVVACPLGCNGFTGKCKVAGVDCAYDSECDDKDPCTLDTCSFKGSCSHSPTAELWFNLSPLVEQNVVAGSEVVVVKFNMSASIYTDMKFGEVLFQLGGTVDIKDVALVKLYKEDNLLGIASVMPGTSNFTVMLTGKTIKAGTTESWTLMAALSPQASGTVGVEVMGAAVIDATTACTNAMVTGLPLQGSTMTIVK